MIQCGLVVTDGQIEVTFCVYACLFMSIQVLGYMYVYACGVQRATWGIVPQDLPAVLVEIWCLTHEVV